MAEYQDEDLRERYSNSPGLMNREQKDQSEQRGVSPKVVERIKRKQELREQYRTIVTAPALTFGASDVRSKIKEIRLKHYDQASSENPRGLDKREIAKGRERLSEEIDKSPSLRDLQSGLIDSCMSDFEDFATEQTGKGRRLEAEELELSERYPDMPVSETVTEIKGLETP